MNRHDIIHAHYLWNKWNHHGQGSGRYKILCRITGYYIPARDAEDSFENLEQVDIYRELLHRSGEAYGYSACLCCSMDVMGIGLCSYCEDAGCSVTDKEMCACSDEGDA